MYVNEGGSFHRVATYGVPAGATIPEQFRPKEGLLGQAAAENHQLSINDVPDGYLAFGSALGQGKPTQLLILPGAVDDEVNTVLELGFIHHADEYVIALLQQISAAIASVVRSAKYRDELRALLAEMQHKSEELQVQGEELRVSNEELEQASRYKSDFLANMSHELRTPLNSLLILAKLLADNTEDNLTAEQTKYAQTIQSSGNDLLTLINDILDLSKIEAGHVTIQPETVPLERLTENLHQLFLPVSQEKQLGFVITTAPDLPGAISTDLQRLEQVLKNLLSNAFKFTERGEVQLEIKPAASNRIAFAVTDTGIGISPDQQAQIFSAFHQADSTISRKYGGTGLGLSISRELARLLGGSIQVQSQPDNGSVFTVIIPESYDPKLVAPREAETPVALPLPAPLPKAKLPPRPLPQDDRANLDLSRRVLLVIEDDENFADILRGLSREMGFQTLLAATAEEALQLAHDFMPSAIILDVGLPDQSGLAVLDRLKRNVRTRHIPIHVVSGADHTQTALSLGAVGYMLKPVKREQLADVLTRLEAKLAQRMHRVLIVEDDERQREAVSKLLASEDTQTIAAGTAAECLDLLRTQTFDCMVLDLSLPDASGYSLLETLSQENAYAFPPVIVYTGRNLTAEDELRLRRYSKSIIIKGAKSPERLLDEVSLFLHHVVSELPDEQQKMIRKARNRDALLEGRRILVVEDDVRNVYALTNILEPRGAIVEIARNGQKALNMLEKSGNHSALAVDLVLMDVMMPVMDGLTATREIRKQPEWKKLPIIALTAKAMPDDQQRCIDAGANDYMAKPLDVEKLLSLVRVWMPR